MMRLLELKIIDRHVNVPVYSQSQKHQKNSANFYQLLSISVDAVAQKLNLPLSSVCKIKANKLCIKGYVKKRFQKYLANQESRAKTGARFVYMTTLENVIIMFFYRR